MKKIQLSEINLAPHLAGYVAFKDKHSRISAVTQKTAHFLGFKNEDQAVGLSDYDLPCEASSGATEFIKQDRNCLRLNKLLRHLDIYRYKTGEPQVLITYKKPFRIKNEQFVFYQGIPIDSSLIGMLCDKGLKKDEYFYPSGDINKSYLIDDDTFESPLTKRELECYFYVLRGYSAREIADQLTRSVRTIESHIENIKNKLNCNSRSELVDYGFHHGYLTVIPNRFLKVRGANPKL